MAAVALGITSRVGSVLGFVSGWTRPSSPSHETLRSALEGLRHDLATAQRIRSTHDGLVW
ncbi:MAG: hypothetical protein HY722_16375 [Planctomycetes bacterium]|nr:hypothetical protein [Planctomycetota bacterium]